MSKYLLFVLIAVSKNSFAEKVAPREDCYLKPCRITGDFDGDHQKDRAVLVKSTGGQRGIAFRLGNGKRFVVGAGKNFGNGGDDFSWMDHWRLDSRPIERGADGGTPPPVKGDHLFVEKTASASAVIYWDGQAFVWYQQGD